MSQSWRTAGSFDADKATPALVDAYQCIFAGNGTEGQAQMVLAHLAQATGFYDVVQSNQTNEQLREHNAKRGVFGEILRFIDLDSEKLTALQRAAKSEKVIL